MNIEVMEIADYDELFSLWQETDGIGLHDDAARKFWQRIGWHKRDDIELVSENIGQETQ